MSISYNADGKLQYFEEWNQLVVCKKCGKPYKQYCEETQVKLCALFLLEITIFAHTVVMRTELVWKKNILTML